MVKLSSFLLPVVFLASSTSAISFRGWSSTGYTGTTYFTTTTGVKNLGFTARSYQWYSADGDGCCIRFCYGGTSTGYRCPSYVNPNVAIANAFNKVVIGCGSVQLNC